MKQKLTLPGLLLLLAITCVCSNHVFSQNFEPGYELLLNSGNYTNKANLQEFSQWFASKSKSTEPLIYRIIQFYKIPNLQTKEMLAQNGIVLHDYIPNKAYLATIASNANINLLHTHNARGIFEIQPSYKLSFEVLTGNYPEHARRENGQVELFVHHFPGLSSQTIKQLFSLNGIAGVENGMAENLLVVRATPEQIQWLSSQPFIYYIEPVNPPAVPDNDTGRTLHRSSTINSDHPLGRKYDGSGIRVMLQDDGIIGPHIDYQGRIPMQYLSNNSGDHGDHCAGIIFGAGNLNPRLRGMATGALLYVYSASGYQGFNSLSTHYTNPGIRITSTSYSDGCNAGYTSLARTMDLQLRLYPKLMHVFSAGNDGASDCFYGAGAGWGNITGGHKAAKNVISVGNLSATDDLAGSSSRGPAKDGRLKPEVCAKGTSVNSTTNPNLYVLKSGTSMSCPGVAGTLAQLNQAYKALNNQVDPPGALMKAIIMNTADDLGNAGPDFRFGFGRINAYKALLVLERMQYDSADIDQEQTILHTINVPANMRQLKIMLYWNDYEGIAGSTKALVNDLDLSVRGPAVSFFSPMILDHKPTVASLNAIAVQGRDSINNVEQVVINMPVAGTYQVRVSGLLVPQALQKYYITWEYVTPDITLTYPIGGESFVPIENETIRWDAPAGTDPFNLFYSADAGTTWTSILSNISATQRHFTWAIPGGLFGKVMLKLTRGTQETIIDHPINVAPMPTNLSIDWACADAFRIKWDPMYGAIGYIIRRLGDRYMDSVAYATKNSYIFTGTNQNETWVSVQAVYSNKVISRRTNSIMRAAGLQNCAASDLAAESIPNADWTVYQTCNDLSNFQMNLRFRNNSGSLITGYSMGYRVNNNTAIVQEQTGTLLPDSSQVAQFAGTINLSTPGSYTLKAWISHPLDGNRNNDTITKQIRVIESAPIAQPSYIQNFDGFPRCVSTPTCQSITCALTEGWINLTNTFEDFIDWRVFGGGTPTSATGPPNDHTTGTNDGNYLYLEPTGLCYNREAILMSPCFNLTAGTSYTIKFWYHMYGADMGRLHVDALVNGNIMRDVIEPLAGDKGNEWREAIIRNIPAGLVIFRFRGITGNGQTSDMAIDDFQITMNVGTEELANSVLSMKIFPNPGSGIFNLSIENMAEEKVNLVVTDMLGKVLMNQKISFNGQNHHHPLDLSHLPNGIYIISAQNSGGRTYQRLIKQ